MEQILYNKIIFVEFPDKHCYFGNPESCCHVVHVILITGQSFSKCCTVFPPMIHIVNASLLKCIWRREHRNNGCVSKCVYASNWEYIRAVPNAKTHAPPIWNMKVLGPRWWSRRWRCCRLFAQTICISRIADSIAKNCMCVACFNSRFLNDSQFRT